MRDDISHMNTNQTSVTQQEPWVFPLEHPLVAVVGPTASGKSEVAQIVASELNGCVLSCDSMQIYRGMDIGTGKVMPKDRTVDYFGIDLVDPGTSYSAALYQRYARDVICQLDNQNTRCVLCGGTGFWMRSVIDDYDFPAGPQTENPVRQKYQRYAQEHGDQSLWDLLAERDPDSAKLLHPKDRKRVIRAFELLADGTSYAENHEKLQHIPQIMPCILFGLSVEPSLLRKRIDVRVDTMFANGFVDEVQTLCAQGFAKGLTAPYAIGYRDVVSALDGKITFEEAKMQMKTETHRYAKRQRTWFRKDKRIMWLDANNYDANRLARQCLASIGKIEKSL